MIATSAYGKFAYITINRSFIYMKTGADREKLSGGKE